MKYKPVRNIFLGNVQITGVIHMMIVVDIIMVNRSRGKDFFRVFFWQRNFAWEIMHPFKFIIRRYGPKDFLGHNG